MPKKRGASVKRARSPRKSRLGRELENLKEQFEPGMYSRSPVREAKSDAKSVIKATVDKDIHFSKVLIFLNMQNQVELVFIIVYLGGKTSSFAAIKGD